jgi:hypothetical protein
MKILMSASCLLALLAGFSQPAIADGDYMVNVAQSPAPSSDGFRMGSSRAPDGTTLTLDSYSLLLNGKPWTPVMGEFHFSRYPENEWREELLKMKAGGVDIVATYVFWIHHEEVEGQFDWSGRRNLHQFLALCKDCGLKAIVRCGPWDHGEVRNGGFPDWLVGKGWKLRSTDTNFLGKTTILYGEISKQLSGLLWKDGGPVIGIQLDNEFHGPAQYLLSLKSIARDAGIDVPIYTKTGWPNLTTPLPFGEMVPLYGDYAEGFWDRDLKPMPGGYWRGFSFSKQKTGGAIGNDILGKSSGKDGGDARQYPFLTCEIGGGMMNSYHRRIFIEPEDVESVAMVKIGSGSVSPGYYMYHGGENPDGKLSTLEESQATGYANDMPVKNYDFQAPLGQYGQVRSQYHLLRRLHLFLHEWGPRLAGMPPFMPEKQPVSKDDLDTLRWDVRSNGREGFLFVNNYQRLQEMPRKTNVQFTVNLPSGALTFPATPVTIPSGACFLWPFNFDLGGGIILNWATARPLTAVDDGKTRTVFFSETKGMAPVFSFKSKEGLKVYSAKQTPGDAGTIVDNIEPSRNVFARAATTNGDIVQLVLLSDEDSKALWKGSLGGRDVVLLTTSEVEFDGNKLRLSTTNQAEITLGICPKPKLLKLGGRALNASRDGVFENFKIPSPNPQSIKPVIEVVKPADQPREITVFKKRGGVAQAPDDADFTKAAVWKITLPPDFHRDADLLMQINYVGDVARVTMNGKLLTDDFYNGKVFEVGLRRYAPVAVFGLSPFEFRLEILPLRKDAPIYFSRGQPDFGAEDAKAELKGIEIIEKKFVELQTD